MHFMNFACSSNCITARIKGNMQGAHIIDNERAKGAHIIGYNEHAKGFTLRALIAIKIIS